MRKNHYCFDVKALMIQTTKLRKVERMVRAYEYLIEQTCDIPTIRQYTHKRDAYQREVDKIRKRLQAVSI